MIPGWWLCEPDNLVHAFDLAEYADKTNLVAACGFTTTRDKTRVTSSGPHCQTCMDCMGALQSGRPHKDMLASLGPVPENARRFRLTERLRQARRRQNKHGTGSQPEVTP